MLYNKHEIKINKHIVDLGEKVHVFYHANAKDRKSAIKTIVESATLSMIFITDTDTNIKSDNERVFIEDIHNLDEVAYGIKTSIENRYSFLSISKNKPKTIDQYMNQLPYKSINENRYILLVINNANKFLKSNYYNAILLALQKGRAAGYHVILMDDRFPNDFSLLANIPTKIVEKENKQDDKNKLN